MKALLPLVVAALLAACGSTGPSDGTGPASDSTAVADTAHQAAAIDLTSYGVPLLLTPPDKQLTNGAEPSIVWKDEIGKLAITAGDVFKLTIVEEPGDLGRLKADLGRDMLKKNTVLQEAPGLLVYKSEFPDDKDLVFIHFYKVVQVGDRTFVVEDVQDGTRYTEQDVQRMVDAIAPKPAA